MKKRKWSKFLLLALVVILGLVGCGKKDSIEEEVANGNSKEKTIKNEIVYAIWTAPTGIFNPTVSDSLYDSTINSVLYNSLLDFDENLSLVSCLAEKYDISEDNLQIRFTLRDGIKWHDGENLTAEDVKFSFESLANPDYKSSNASFVEAIVGSKDFVEKISDEISGIKVIDSKTLELNFERVYAPALTQLGTSPIIPKHIWKDIPIENWVKETNLLTNPVGTGAYKMEEYKIGEFVKLVKNEDYFKGEVKTNNLIFKVANENTAQAELVNGSIDIASISGAKKKDLDYLLENKIQIASYPNSNIQYMGTNLRDEILADRNIRQAMAYGLDRKLIVDELIDGNGVVINAPMVPSLWSYPDKGVLNEYTRDVDKAKELIMASGYELKDGVFQKDGKKLKFTLTYPSGDKTREMVAPIIQSQLKDIGIEIELEMMEFSSLMDKVVGNHEFELYLMANTLTGEPDPKPTWYSTAASDEKGVFGWNISGFRNEKVDELLDEGLATLVEHDRKAIYQDFALIMNEELPWIPLYVPNVIQAYSEDLKDYKPGTFRNFFEIEKWYIEK